MWDKIVKMPFPEDALVQEAIKVLKGVLGDAGDIEAIITAAYYPQV